MVVRGRGGGAREGERGAEEGCGDLAGLGPRVRVEEHGSDTDYGRLGAAETTRRRHG